jgi:pimeloyl-ACP methyl ester carboxylesterase
VSAATPFFERLCAAITVSAIFPTHYVRLMPNISGKCRAPAGVTVTARLSRCRCSQWRSKQWRIRQAPTWGERYLDSDPDGRRHDPVGVKIPTRPFNDIIHAWHGDLAYDPALVQAPVAIIRGEWDGVIPDADARWLFDAFKASPTRRDIKIGRATHLMHLEEMRYALYRESIGFLLADDKVPVPQPVGA